jgi:hypothetical protein
MTAASAFVRMTQVIVNRPVENQLAHLALDDLQW